MAYTGKLGTHDSQLGNILFGGDVAPQITGSTNNTITFTQTATAEVVNPFKDATNNITFTQSVNVLRFGSSTATNTLTFTQTARGYNGSKRILQTLTFTHDIAVNVDYVRSLQDQLLFSQFAGAERINPASNTITFTQDATALTYKGTYSDFVISQTVTYNYDHSELLVQALTFTQTVSPGAVFNRAITQTLTFTHTITARRVKILSASNVIVFRDYVVPGKIFQLTQSLNFVQTLTGYRIINQTAGNTLSLSHALIRQMTYNLSAVNSLVFQNGFYRELEIGDSGGAGDEVGNPPIFDPDDPPPPASNPRIWVPEVVVTKPTRRVVLQTAFRAITLKRPLLGDTESGMSSMIKQRSVNGKTYTYARRTDRRKLKYEFEVPRTKMLELRAYILASLSTPMKLENWKGEIWYGYITNNPFEISSKGRSTPCGGDEEWKIEIEFEGMRVH